MWEETEGLLLLFWSALYVGEREVRWERWERWEGSEVVRWEKWEGSEVER